MIDFLLVASQVMMVICGIMAVRLLVISIMEAVGMRYFICDEYGWREVSEEVYKRFRGKKLARVSKKEEEE